MLGALSDMTCTIFTLPSVWFVIKFGRLENLRIALTLHVIGWILMAVSPNLVFVFVSTITVSMGSGKEDFEFYQRAPNVVFRVGKNPSMVSFDVGY